MSVCVFKNASQVLTVVEGDLEWKPLKAIRVGQELTPSCFDS